MEKQLVKIYEQIEAKQQVASLEELKQAFDFLNTSLESIPKNKSQQIQRRALRLAHNYSLRPVQPAVIAVFVLHNLVEEDSKHLKSIKQNFSPQIYKMLNAYGLASKHLTGKMWERNVFDHTINTALQISELQLGHEAVCASFLKHLPECSNVSLEDIKKQFGADVHDIIVNHNRLKQITTTTNKKNIKHLRQMFLSMSQELRAILLKMCSHIDWLKHIEDLPENDRQRFAIEAIEIYAPIADILGIWDLKWQLEDYAFKYLHPTEYQKIEKRFHVDEKKNRVKYIEKTKRLITKEAEKANINCTVHGRFKHFYSIHEKMQQKKKAFNEIYDVFALTVVVDTAEDCYRLLGIIHSIWKAKPRRVKDYISNPKNNNYQSLHTTVFGINNRMTEFQIRTHKMDNEANFGVAAHWTYKNTKVKPPSWIKNLLKEQMRAKTDEDFLNKVNTSVLVDQIFVFTPKGDMVSLPKASTPVDFAYHIHTDIGHKCKAVLINGDPAPLNQELKNQDKIQIVVDNKQVGPQETWLNFVKSNVAKKSILYELEKQDETSS